MLHVDWHLARPEHHRLSLGWPYHWIVTAIVFGVVGWGIARMWPTARWRLGVVVFTMAVLLAQGVEPLLEVAFFQGRLGYPSDPGRWQAFGRAIAAATPAFWGAIWLGANRASRLQAS
jgi:hypothetical protein